MTTDTTRTRPLVAVLFGVPLFVEAMRGAFDDLADVHAYAADGDDVEGLLEALKPDGLIVEGRTIPDVRVPAPALHVDLEERRVRIRRAGAWDVLDIDLTPPDIRNALMAGVIGARP